MPSPPEPSSQRMAREIAELQKSGILDLGIPHSVETAAVTPGAAYLDFTSSPLPARPRSVPKPHLRRGRRPSRAGPRLGRQLGLCGSVRPRAPGSHRLRVRPRRLLPSTLKRLQSLLRSRAGGESAEAGPRGPHLRPPAPG